jgi:hypothetical protein
MPLLLVLLHERELDVDQISFSVVFLLLLLHCRNRIGDDTLDLDQLIVNGQRVLIAILILEIWLLLDQRHRLLITVELLQLNLLALWLRANRARSFDALGHADQLMRGGGGGDLVLVVLVMLGQLCGGGGGGDWRWWRL